jgi:hypothetical protein
MHFVRLFRLAKHGTHELRTYLNAAADAVLDQPSNSAASISPQRLRSSFALSLLDDLLNGAAAHAASV